MKYSRLIRGALPYAAFIMARLLQTRFPDFVTYAASNDNTTLTRPRAQGRDQSCAKRPQCFCTRSFHEHSYEVP